MSRDAAALVGAGHLALAGAVNAVTGGALCYLAADGTLTRLALAADPSLAAGRALGVATTSLPFALGVVLLGLAPLQVAAAAGVSRGRGLRRGAGLGAASVANPLAFPLGLVAAGACLLARP